MGPDIITAVHESKLPSGIDFVEDDGRRIFALTKSSGEFDSFAIYLRYGGNKEVRAEFAPAMRPGFHRKGTLGCCEVRFSPGSTPEELMKRIREAALEFAEFMEL